MSSLINDFGELSIVAAYRYDDPPLFAEDRRGCVISIELHVGAGETVRYRLLGYTRAVSDLHKGHHVRLYGGDDPQIEFERFSLVVDKDGQRVVLYCADAQLLPRDEQ